MINTIPFCRPVTLEEASFWSPWPDRISGKAPWKKRSRNYTDINDEYDTGLYSMLKGQWDALKQEFPTRSPQSLLNAFYDRVDRLFLESMLELPDVYGEMDLKQHLMSSGTQLLLGDIFLGNSLHLNLVTDRLHRQLTQCNVDTIVELGCGAGGNLFNIFSLNCVPNLVGCDLCSSSVDFLNKFSAEIGCPAKFKAGDMTSPALLEELALAANPWCIITVHAVEQLTDLSGDWINLISTLPKPPSFVMHFEPLQWREDTEFDRCCEKYAEINLYNSNLLQLVQRKEKQGVAEILSIEKRIWGVVAFNPTSVLTWKPAGN